MSDQQPTAQQWEKSIAQFIDHLKFQESEHQIQANEAMIKKERVQKIRMELEHHLYKEKLTP